jgi:hypothetical protein
MVKPINWGGMLEPYLQPLKERLGMLPLGQYEDGSVRLAWPGMLADTFSKGMAAAETPIPAINDDQAWADKSAAMFDMTSLAPMAGAGVAMTGARNAGQGVRRQDVDMFSNAKQGAVVPLALDAAERAQPQGIRAWDRIAEIERGVPDELARALDDWVGGPVDAVERGLSGGVMMPSTLESIPLERLNEMAAPFRDALRSEYGDTVRAYRGESGGGQSAGRKNILGSYTTDRAVAERFAGAGPERPLVSPEEIAAAERMLNETGGATLGRTTYRKGEGGYVDMYDKDGQYITDTGSIREQIDWENSQAAAENAKRAEALARVRDVSIPIDDIMAATDRFNQKELIARFLYANAPTGAAIPAGMEAAQQDQDPQTMTTANILRLLRGASNERL